MPWIYCHRVRHEGSGHHEMSLFDVEAIFLQTVISYVITNECLYMFAKRITADYERLQPCDVHY